MLCFRQNHQFLRWKIRSLDFWPFSWSFALKRAEKFKNTSCFKHLRTQKCGASNSKKIVQKKQWSFHFNVLRCVWVQTSVFMVFSKTLLFSQIYRSICGSLRLERSIWEPFPRSFGFKTLKNIKNTYVSVSSQFFYHGALDSKLDNIIRFLKSISFYR